MEKYLPDQQHIIMSRDQVRSVDRWAIETLGIPGVVLMENAGRSCAELIKEKLAPIENPKVCIFCGTGNNGGDGYVIARHLLNADFNVELIICGERSKVKGDAAVNLEILQRIDRTIQQINMETDDIAERVESFTEDANMLVDCVFGTGLSGQLRDDYNRLIESINAINVPVLAVDIPSGLDCDTAEPLGAAVRADYTVTFVALKKGFTYPDAPSYTGEVFIASIGIEPPKDLPD